MVYKCEKRKRSLYSETGIARDKVNEKLHQYIQIRFYFSV